MKTTNQIVFLICLLTIPFFSNSQNISVQREYDKNGNLIRYDSTYVYSWSSDSTHHFFPDSAFLKFSDIHEMRERMQEQMQHLFNRDSSVNKSFHHPFFSDEFFDKDFFDPQFNRRNFFNQDSSRREFFKNLEEMMEGHHFFRQEENKEMHKNLDSLHNEFMKERKEYFRKRDSIYRNHQKKKSDKIDI